MSLNLSGGGFHIIIIEDYIETVNTHINLWRIR